MRPLASRTSVVLTAAPSGFPGSPQAPASQYQGGDHNRRRGKPRIGDHHVAGRCNGELQLQEHQDGDAKDGAANQSGPGRAAGDAHPGEQRSHRGPRRHLQRVSCHRRRELAAGLPVRVDLGRQERQREQVGDDQQPANLRLARHQVRAEPLVQPRQRIARAHHEDACRGPRIDHHSIARASGVELDRQEQQGRFDQTKPADQPDEVFTAIETQPHDAHAGEGERGNERRRLAEACRRVNRPVRGDLRAGHGQDQQRSRQPARRRPLLSGPVGRGGDGASTRDRR